MLNQHRNLLVAQSDRLQVGDCIVDIPSREVTAPGRSRAMRITLKAQQVLLVLISHHGRVVSREALLEWVWPDTMPTDDVLTQAITQLRKAFGDDRDAPRYLETIAKGGYRLFAPLQWLDVTTASEATPASAGAPQTADVAIAAPLEVAAVLEPATPPAAVIASARQSHGKTIGLVALAVIAAVVSIVLFNRLDQQKWVTAKTKAAPGKPLTYETITSRPGREVSPNLSPDGAMVAYAEALQPGAGTAIMIQTTAQATPRQLTQPAAGNSDHLPVWSHDGRRLAFVRSGDQQCQIMLIAATGGDERKVADCHGEMFSFYDWTPDDSGLLMGQTRDKGETRSPLRLLDLATGRWRALDYPIGDGDTDLNPHYSPDGRWLVFRRSVSLSDLWRMPANGGTPERLTQLRADIRGWDWLPDGSALVFNLNGGEEPGLYRFSLADRAMTRLDVETQFFNIDIAPRTDALVGELSQIKMGLFRYGTAGKSEPQQLFASSGSDLLPSLSPDGTQLAFISDRSMRSQLWIGALARPESLRVVPGYMPVPRHAPVWSADGKKLLVIGLQDRQQVLFEVDVGTDVVRRLPVPGGAPVHATYTAQADRLLVVSDVGSGRLHLSLYDTSKQPWQTLATIEDVALPKIDSATQQIYFTRPARAGLWRTDPQLRTVTQIDEESPGPWLYRDWTLADGGIRVMGANDVCGLGWRRLGRPSSDLQCLDATRSLVMASTPSVSSSSSWLIVGAPVSDNVDIGWIVLSEKAAPPAKAPAKKS